MVCSELIIICLDNLLLLSGSEIEEIAIISYTYIIHIYPYKILIMPTFFLGFEEGNRPYSPGGFHGAEISCYC